MMVANSFATYTAPSSTALGVVTGAYSASGQTVRQIVHTGPGGTAVKIKLSNMLGAQPIILSDVHVALRAIQGGPPPADNSAVSTATDHPVTFNNSATVTIPAGQDMESDPITWTLPPNSDVTVSFYVQSGQLASSSSTGDMPANSAYIVAGDQSAVPSFSTLPVLPAFANNPLTQVYLLEDVEVLAPSSTRNIVAIGDSITYGVDASNPITNSYPSILYSLINASSNAYASVINAGIGSNELTTAQGGYQPTVQVRFQHDVLDHPGVTDVIVLIGTNDLERGTGNAVPTVISANIIAGYQSLIQMARAQNPNIKIHGGTITPFGSYTGIDSGGVLPWASDAARLAVNSWIMTKAASQGGFDDVVDFSGAVAGTPPAPAAGASATAAAPLALASSAATASAPAILCSGPDGLHPADQGYKAMGTLAYDVLYKQAVQPAAPCNNVLLAP
jgi:lysophospholipase L1-like esterase